MIVAEIGVAAAALLATNVDNVLALSGMFMDEYLDGRDVATGFVLGTAAVIALSAVVAVVAATFPQHLRYARLLGFVPLAIAMRELWQPRALLSSGQSSSMQPAPAKARDRTQRSRGYVHASHVLIAAGVTLSCSVDNAAVYTAVFVQEPPRGMVLGAAVFLLLSGGLCVIGHRISEVKAVRRYAAVAAPLLLIGVAMWIFAGA